MSRRILKWLGILLLVLVLGFGVLVLAVRYFFPNETVRDQLQAYLSQQVQGTVTIESLEFDLLNGLQIHQVDARRNGTKVAHLDGLTLDYSPWHLIWGALVLNEVTLTGADLSLDLDQLAAQKAKPVVIPLEPGSDQELDPTHDPSAQVSVIPLAVDLRELNIQDSHVRIQQGDRFVTDINDVELEAELSASLAGAHLSGTLSVAQADATVDGKRVQLPLSMDFDMSGSLLSGAVTITRLVLRSDPGLKLALSGRVEEALSRPVVDLLITDSSIDVEQLLVIGREFLPPQLAEAELQGMLAPTIVIKGVQLDTGFDGVIDAEIAGRDVGGVLPSFDATLKPAALTLRSTGIQIKENRPGKIAAELALTGQGAAVQSYRLTTFEVKASGEHDPSGLVSGALMIDGLGTTPPMPPLESLTQPVVIKVDGSGNLGKGGYSISQGILELGELAKVSMSADLGAAPSSTKRGAGRDFSMTAQIEPRLERLLALLPGDLRQGLLIREDGKGSRINLKASGRLGPTLEPEHVDFSGTVGAKELAAAMQELEARANVDGLNLEVSGVYRAAKTKNAGPGSLKTDISGTVVLSDLQYGQSARAGSATVTLRSLVRGAVEPDLHISSLRSQDTVGVQWEQVSYEDTSDRSALRATLPGLTVSARTREDLLAGTYQVNDLIMKSGEMFEILAEGRYRKKDRGFWMEVSVPSVRVGSLMEHVSYAEPLERMPEGKTRPTRTKPRGVIAMKLAGAGTIPEGGTLDPLNLPVRVSGRVRLTDVSAAYGEHEIVAANGTVNLLFQPEDNDRLMLSSRVRADSLRLPGVLPVTRVSGLSADLAATAEQFDEINLKQLRVRVDGADLSADGSAAGVRAFLERNDKPPFHVLGSLFLNLRSRLGIDLERFAGTLKPYGIEGTGRADIALSVLKKEMGPADIRVQLIPRHLTVLTGSTRVVDLDGALAMRKVLKWYGGGGTLAGAEDFTPSAVLPGLKSQVSAQPDLSIKRIDLPAVSINTVTSDVRLNRDTILVQDLKMSLLDGGARGALTVAGGSSFGVTIDMEASQLDVNQLLRPERRVRGDSRVDGTLNLRAFVDGAQGNLDFGRTELQLYFSRIGRDALNRLLLFLDPEGSNPSVVQARAIVQVANPSTVRVTLEKGLMAGRLEFREGFVPEINIPRVPVERIKPFRDITKTIPYWEAIRAGMRFLGATRYGVDPTGRLVLE